MVMYHLIYPKLNLLYSIINNKAIDEVKFIRYLGVTLDAQLSFKYHIDELTKKTSRGIGLIQTSTFCYN